MNLTLKVLCGTLGGLAITGVGTSAYFLSPSKPQPLTKASWDSFINNKEHKHCWNLLSTDNKKTLLFVCRKSEEISTLENDDSDDEEYYFWNGVSFAEQEQITSLRKDASGKKVEIIDSEDKTIGSIENNVERSTDKKWNILIDTCDVTKKESENLMLTCPNEDESVEEEVSSTPSIKFPLKKLSEISLES